MNETQPLGLTPQELFDQTVEYLRNQTERAYDDLNESCVYRTPEGNACAIGHFIPEELHLSDHVLTEAVSSLMESVPAIAILFGDYSQALLGELQGLHDSVEHRMVDCDLRLGGLSALGEECAAQIAVSHDLTYTPPKEEAQ